MNNLLTEEEVKTKLGIPDFRSIKKDQLIEFVSMIPNMDKEVAKACIAQFPQFKEYSTGIVSLYDDVCKKAMETDSKDSIEAYRSIIDTMSKMLERENISVEEKHYLIDKMVEIGEKIEVVEDKKRGLVQFIIKAAGTVTTIALSAGAAILGVKLIGNKS